MKQDKIVEFLRNTKKVCGETWHFRYVELPWRLVKDLETLSKEAEELLGKIQASHKPGEFLPIRMYLDGIEHDLAHLAMIAEKHEVGGYQFRWNISEDSIAPTFRESIEHLQHMIRKRVMNFFMELDISNDEQFTKGEEVY